MFQLSLVLERSNSSLPLAMSRSRLVAGIMTSLEMVRLLPQAMRVSLAIPEMSTSGAIAPEMRR